MRSTLVVLTLLAPLPLAAAAGEADGAAAKDPRNLSWVEPGVLAIGGGGLDEAQVAWLHEQGFRAIADFRAEHADPADAIGALGMDLFDMPIESAADINATQLASFVAWAQAQKEAGRPVYIHCTNGWHRAAAFAVAWRMATTGASYDEAARDQVALRPGTAMRAIPGLLAYHAELRGEPALAIAITSPASRPQANATMDVVVEVYAGGAPAADATVSVWSEETRLRFSGVTDAAGRLTFAYAAPSQPLFMDHLYARASLAGFADAADSIEVYFEAPARARGPLEVAATRVDGALVVEVTSGGKPVAARIVANAPGWSASEASVEGRVRFPDAPADAISVRALAWGAETGVVHVDPLPSPVPPPEPAPAPAPQPDARAPSADASLHSALAAATGALVLASGAWVLVRRRAAS